MSQSAQTARRILAEGNSPDAIAPDTGNPGFGVYLHWPFCAAKCPYCDFNSHVRHAGVDQQAYVAAFAREIATMREISGPRVVTSMFFGGGTPSLMAPGTVAAILDAVRAAWVVPDGIEITLEANPSSVEAGGSAAYRDAGFNRVSTGRLQPLNDADLKRAGNGCMTGPRRMKAIGAWRARSFPADVFSTLIYARPDQTPQAWAAELKEAISLAAASSVALPAHHRGKARRFYGLHKAGQVIRYRMTISRAELIRTETPGRSGERHGLPAYEVLQPARPGPQSRNNLTYLALMATMLASVPGRPWAACSLQEARFATATERSPGKMAGSLCAPTVTA